MNIQLKDWKVNSLVFRMESSDIPNGFNLDTKMIYIDGDLLKFGIAFKLNLTNKDFVLNIEMTYMFSLEQEITAEFKNSNFPKINAPAIAYPYLRAFISNLTLQSGIPSVILPSINFVKFSEQKEVIQHE